MKKISIILFILTLCLFLTGCNDKTKETKSLETFDTISTNNGFTTYSTLANYSKETYIIDAIKATKDNNIEIEMINYDTEESAKKVQDKQIDGFMGLKSANAVINKDKGKNYYKYTMISNRYYMITSRIDNTLVFSKTKVENKDTVDKIFNELGY